MLKKLFLIIFIWITAFTFPDPAFADTSLPSITVVNLIRGNQLGHENDDILSSLEDQYSVTKDAGIKATWLIQYSALEIEGLTDFAKKEMEGHEFGLLFEIDRNSSEKADVQFRGQGPWYFSDGLLLPSYDTDERKKIIDESFKKFKEEFGYYPKTVGAWWMGADSLTYMQRKYGITASLRASDQFNLDFYSLWGGPWSIPYVSSKYNQAIPVSIWDDGTKVVNLQWAARDPLRGHTDPLYSMQDYPIKGYDPSYVDYLSSIFLRGPNDNVVFGLENGGDVEVFNKFYKTMLDRANELKDQQKADIVLARDFASKFLSEEKAFAGTRFFLSQDYNSDDQSFWYMSENYRAAVHKIGAEVYLVDLQDYSERLREDFSVLPNSQSVLRTRAPFIIDSQRLPNQKKLIATTDKPLTIKERPNGSVVLMSGDQALAEFNDGEVNIYSDEKTSYSFSKAQRHLNVSKTVSIFFLLYFLVIYAFRRNLKQTLIESLILGVPLVLALSYLKLESDMIYLFDRKEVFLMNLFPLSMFSDIQSNVILFKIMPLFLLLVSHFLFTIKYRKTILYLGVLFVVTLLYAHVPYFPLDRTTIVYIVFFLAITGLILGALAIFYFYKTRNKRRFAFLLVGIPIVLIILFGVIAVSRSRYILTPFEIEALQVVKNQEKEVLVVYQVVHNVKPIYKAIRPLIYENNKTAGYLTGKGWTTVIRPEDNVLKIENLDNKIILVPRYLGADLSDNEMDLLMIKKTFDNAQVSIFEE